MCSSGVHHRKLEPGMSELYNRAATLPNVITRRECIGSCVLYWVQILIRPRLIVVSGVAPKDLVVLENLVATALFNFTFLFQL
jgi:hypothetical protein